MAAAVESCPANKKVKTSVHQHEHEPSVEHEHEPVVGAQRGWILQHLKVCLFFGMIASQCLVIV